MAERNVTSHRRRGFGERSSGRILAFPTGEEYAPDIVETSNNLLKNVKSLAQIWTLLDEEGMDVRESRSSAWAERSQLLGEYLDLFRDVSNRAPSGPTLRAARSRTVSPEAPSPAEFMKLYRLGLAKEILSSRSLLELEDDWDDCGSPAYAEGTWNRAISLLVQLATRLREDCQMQLTSAEVLPGSQGNIDLELRTGNRRLLLSIPPSPDAPARYYGQDQDETRTIKGTLIPSDPNRWLVAWLAE